MSFTKKVVFITGAASNIGAVTAIKLAQENAKLALVDSDEENLREITKICSQYTEEVQPIIADVSRDDEAVMAVREAINTFEAIHVFINSTGTTSSVASILDKNVMQEFDRVMPINTRAGVYLTQLIAPYLIKTKGNIVNIVSSGVLTPSYFFLMGISKACLNHFTKCVALELGEKGVRVNSVLPGLVSLNKVTKNPMYEYMQEKNIGVLNKMADPEEIAELIAFIASDKGKSITGASYLIDNGRMLDYEKLR